MVWFYGISDNDSLIANVSNIEHDPDEVERYEPNEIEYDWRKNL